MQSESQSNPPANNNPLISGSSYFNEHFPFIWPSLNDICSLNNQKMATIERNIQNDSVNFAIGSMFGAFIGDALGAYCQFRTVEFKEQDPILNMAMKMPGKGTFNIKPGQFTDDSELASHMLEGLCSFNPLTSFQKQKTSILMKIAEQYVVWYKSDPFDIGGTTRNALNILRKDLYEMKLEKQDDDQFNEAQGLTATLKIIEKKNIQSCSNGSLMRNTPMAFFISLLLQQKQYQGLKCQDFRDFIMSEINMTHGHPEIFESSYAWVELLVELILRKKNKRSLKEVFDQFIQKYQNNQFIGEWIQGALNQQYMDATECQGWARIAFTYGIKSLQTMLQINEEDLSEENFTKIMKKVIGKAGDSDTNAAIVGGLIGAVIGFTKLPKDYLNKQFSLQLDMDDQECSFRGPFYEPRLQFYKAMKLIQKFNSSQKQNT